MANGAPACQAIAHDNALGKFVFAATRLVQRWAMARRAVVQMTAREQRRAGGARRMSLVLWDMFTGSAPYREILLRTLHPGFWLWLLWDLAGSAWARRRIPSGAGAAASQAPGQFG